MQSQQVVQFVGDMHRILLATYSELHGIKIEPLLPNERRIFVAVLNTADVKVCLAYAHAGDDHWITVSLYRGKTHISNSEIGIEFNCVCYTVEDAVQEVSVLAQYAKTHNFQ